MLSSRAKPHSPATPTLIQGCSGGSVRSQSGSWSAWATSAAGTRRALAGFIPKALMTCSGDAPRANVKLPPISKAVSATQSQSTGASSSSGSKGALGFSRAEHGAAAPRVALDCVLRRLGSHFGTERIRLPDSPRLGRGSRHPGGKPGFRDGAAAGSPDYGVAKTQKASLSSSLCFWTNLPYAPPKLVLSF